MELLKVESESFRNETIAKYLNKWSLIVFREGIAETAPIVLVYCAAADDVLRQWNQLVHDIALYVQAELPKDSRRNLSLIFITSSLPQGIIREIRDDTYCCKKIVLEASGVNAFQELNRYYLGDHTKKPFNLHIDQTLDSRNQPLSSYILDKHPEIKQIMSSKL